jgi:hypothetical protein
MVPMQTLGGRWLTLSSPLKWVPHPFRSFIAERVGNPSPDLVTSGFPSLSIPRLLSGADRPKAVGPTAGGQVAHPIFATEMGAPSFPQFHRGKGGNPSPCRALACPRTSLIPRLFPGADQPKAVGRTAGAWPHCRWRLQRITLHARTMKTCGSIPLSGREPESPKKGYPLPPGGPFHLFFAFQERNMNLSIFFSAICQLTSKPDF